MTENQMLDKLCKRFLGNTPYVADGIIYGSACREWGTAHPRVLFVMKQPNSNDLLGEDYREYELDTLLGNQNWEQLLARLYGIVHTTTEGCPSYEEATEKSHLIQTFRTHPFACMNLNKEEGCGTTSISALRRYAQEHAEFIRQQIDILRPHIVVCCGVGVFDAVNAVMQPSVPSSGNWVKYNQTLDILYFDTYHPGKPMAGRRLVEAYEMPLKEYCEFLKTK